MPEIFVGRGEDGEFKYLSQVPSGLACQCTCLVCNGPLIARKGQINEWHFAHAGGQTHVDCIVGARNFLRKMAAEVLCRAPSMVRVKPNERRVSFAHLSQTIVLNDEIRELVVKSFPLDAKVGMATIVATGTTVHEKIPFNLHVQVEGEDVSVLGEHEKGLLLLRVPYLATDVLRSEEETRQAIAHTMTLEWQYLPNVHTTSIRTLQSLQARHQAEEAAQAERMRLQTERQQQATARMTGHTGLPQAPQFRAMPVAMTATEESGASFMAQSPAGASAPEWVSHYGDNTSLFCHRFRDGSYWLLGKSNDRWLLHPWPVSEDGWDEALPPSLGVPDEELGGYICGANFLEAIQRVNAFSIGVQNTRDPGELHRMFQILGWQ